MASEACQIADEAVAASAAALAAFRIRHAGSGAVVNSIHFHEAAHAICMVALGCPPDAATIVASADALGRVSRGATKLTAGDLGAISMAGIVAQREYLKRAGLPLDEETLAAAGSTDMADVRAMLSEHKLDCRPDMFISIATARAEKLLEEHWPRVERLAAELLTHGTLDREQIEAAYAGAAEGVLDAA